MHLTAGYYGALSVRGGFEGETADNIYYARFQNGRMRVCRGFGRFARFHSVIWALCPRLEDGPGWGPGSPGRGVWWCCRGGAWVGCGARIPQEAGGGGRRAPEWGSEKGTRFRSRPLYRILTELKPSPNLSPFKDHCRDGCRIKINGMVF